MDIVAIIDSGILDKYVLGQTTQDDSAWIDELKNIHPEIKEEIEAISATIEELAMSDSINPNPSIKPFLMATLDYMKRMENNESPSNPPLLHQDTKITEFETWLQRDDMILPTDADSVYAKIIGNTSEALTAIVWLKEGSPIETHEEEYERFLIVEGTCEIGVEDERFHLSAGDYFQIPLHKKHFVKVTSTIPCKVVLQRVAA